jgi:hypothetical protein
MIKRLSFVSVLVLAAAIAAAAQSNFPGLSPAAKKQLATAKRSVAFALPTWVPAGFTLSQVVAKVGAKVKLENKQLIFVYTRELANGRMQRFAFEAGFDGIGDLMYDGPRTLRTPIGKVHLYYQPKDEEGKKIADFAMTEWFDVRGTAFHYSGTYEAEGASPDEPVMLTLADTEKILRSLTRY